MKRIEGPMKRGFKRKRIKRASAVRKATVYSIGPATGYRIMETGQKMKQKMRGP